MPEVDPAQVEGVAREYYDAFNAYDPARVEAVYTKGARKEEGGEIAAWVRWAKSAGFRSEYVSLDSLKTEGISVWATVTVESPLGSGQDFINLVWERNSWKIAQLLTRKAVQVLPVEEPSSGSCCS